MQEPKEAPSTASRQKEQTLASPAHYPLFLDLKGRKVVVCGGGSVACMKIRNLIPTGAQITVISPSLISDCHHWQASGRFTWLARPYALGDLAGATLAFAATNDQAVNRQILEEGRGAHVLVTLCDAWEQGDFINGAWLRQEPLSICVSTEGSHPTASRLIRDYLQQDRLLAKAIPLIKSLAEKRHSSKKQHSTAKEQIRHLLHELSQLLGLA